MKRSHWKVNAFIGEIILWLLVASLAVILGTVMERLALKKFHGTDPGATGKGAVASALVRSISDDWALRNENKGQEGKFGRQAELLSTSYGKLPMSFEPNQGQAAKPVAFLSRGHNYSLFFTPTEAVLNMPDMLANQPGRPSDSRSSPIETSRNRAKELFQLGPFFRQGSSHSPSLWSQLHLKFKGIASTVRLEGEDLLSRKSNYFIGRDTRTWKHDIPHYSRIHYSNAYPGIDLVFYGNQQELEYDVVVGPGANSSLVSFSFEVGAVGQESIQVVVDSRSGDLVLRTSSGEVRQRHPLAYQIIHGKKEMVTCRYVVNPDQQVGFEVGSYDPRSVLVIDPVLSYSVVGIGGSAIAVDSSGSAYVAGIAGPGFVTTPGAFQSEPGGGTCASGPNTVPCADILVAKLNSAGTDLVYSTFLGGNGSDYSYGLALDPSGNVYLTGTTDSGNFPTTENALQTRPPVCASGSFAPPCTSAFVTKMNPNGTALIYSSYLSGTAGGTSGNGIAVDANGGVCITGDTGSEGFFTRLSPDGKTVVASTTGIGGAGVAVDDEGNAYVVGRNGTASYVTKTKGETGEVAYSYRLGGSFPQYSAPIQEVEGLTGVAVDLHGNVYVTGYTAYNDFPTTPNAAYPNPPGVGICGTSICRDAFVAKLTADGNGLVYSTYLGGSSVDYATAIAVDLSGNTYVTGVTRSADFPRVPANLVGSSGGIFVSKLNAEGTSFLFSYTLGTGQSSESGNAITVDSQGNAYVTGNAGPGFVGTAGSYRPNTGSNGSFVAKIFENVTLFVPIVLSAPGQNGSYFTSELALTNRSTAESSLEFTYAAAFGGGDGKVTDKLAAGTQRIVPDAIAYLRSLGISVGDGEGHGGTLKVCFTGLSSPLEGSVTVRTTTRVPQGKAGLAYGGITRALTEPAYLCGLRQNNSDRTNVAIQNAGTEMQGSIIIRLEIFSSDSGIPPGIAPVVLEESLAPGQFKQISGILRQGGALFGNGFVRVSRVQGIAPYYAYAVINDQSSSDGSYVAPFSEGSLVGKRRMTLPVVVEIPQFGTELVVTNISASTKILDLEFVSDNIQAPSNVARVKIALGPHEQEILPNFVNWMRQQGARGMPVGASYVGPLFASVENGDLDGVFLGAGTSTVSQSGRFGVFYGPVPEGSASQDSAWLYDLQQSESDRTNLGLVNTGEVDDTPDFFRVEIYDGEKGKPVGTVENLKVGTKRLRQIGSFLEKYVPGTRQGYVRVTRTQGNNPFVAYAVINDGASPGQGSGDGAFISSNP